MDSATTTWFLACILLLGMRITPFTGAQLAPADNPATTGGGPPTGSGADGIEGPGACPAPSAALSTRAASAPGAASDASAASTASTASDASAAAGGARASDVAPSAAPGGPPIVPCYFIFGDSLADSGNNNELKTLAKANFLPYGIDYPAGPTGRFTNGRTYVDFIAEFLGFPNHIPPYATSRGTERVLQGVNYASSGAGIRPETGKIVGERIDLFTQLEHHRSTVAHIKKLKGDDEHAAVEYLGKCLYTVGIGSNDYLNNYLLAQANRRAIDFLTPDSWAEELARRINAFLRALHDLGAKKVALYGLGPIGCAPSQVKQLRMDGKPGCSDNVNRIVSLYNQRLPAVIDDVNKSLPDAKFILVNNSHISPGTNPGRIGVKISDTPCCQVDAVGGTCIRGSTPCTMRGDFSFYDMHHPTEKAVLPGVRRSWQALEPQDTYPMDISHLVQL